MSLAVYPNPRLVDESETGLTMILNLNDDQHEALSDLVSHSVADLSHEIAATDNWEYREMLRGRRDRLTEISGQFESADRPLPS